MHMNCFQCFQYVKMMIWWDLWVLSYDWEHVDWVMFYVSYNKLRNACIDESLWKAWDEMNVLMKVYEKHEMRWIA
jgi:hypothetical protein